MNQLTSLQSLPIKSVWVPAFRTSHPKPIRQYKPNGLTGYSLGPRPNQPQYTVCWKRHMLLTKGLEMRRDRILARITNLIISQMLCCETIRGRVCSQLTLGKLKQVPLELDVYSQYLLYNKLEGSPHEPLVAESLIASCTRWLNSSSQIQPQSQSSIWFLVGSGTL